MSYADEELLDGLRQFAAEHGHPPTAAEANDEETLANPSTFRDHFGNWNAAVKAAGLEPRYRERSDDDLLDALHAFADEHGRLPKSAEIEDAEAMPSAVTYHHRFGSWNAALEAAGLTPRSRQWTDEALLDVLREFADKYGHSPTIAEMDAAETFPSHALFESHFGSWNNAIEAAGLPPHKPRYTDAEMLEKLREFADEHGRPPTTVEPSDHEALPSASAYRKRFGSWNAALEAAGFEPHHRHYTDAELLDALRAFAAEHDGRPPTYAETNDTESLPSTSAFRSHFGNWSAALEAAGFEPYHQRRSEKPDE